MISQAPPNHGSLWWAYCPSPGCLYITSGASQKDAQEKLAAHLIAGVHKAPGQQIEKEPKNAPMPAM